MQIGYARVSTKEQLLDLQLNALRDAGCELIFKEYITGATSNRPELQRLLEQVRKDDVIVVWKLDRLGRSLSDLVAIINDLQARGVGFRSLQDSIDTTTAQGKFTFHLFAAVAEFERSLIQERTKAGLAAARARGRVGGRPKGLSQVAEEKAKIAALLYKQGELSIQGICTHLSIGKMTLYRYLRHKGVVIGASAERSETQ